MRMFSEDLLYLCNSNKRNIMHYGTAIDYLQHAEQKKRTF